MIKNLICIFAIVVVLAVSNCSEGEGVPVSMVAATSIEGDALPFEVLGSSSKFFGLFGGKEFKEFKGEKGATHVKIHIYPDKPIEISQIKIEACSNLRFVAHAYINFNESVKRLEVTDDTLSSEEFHPISARSVTINFGENEDICIDSINFYNPEGKKHRLIRVETVEGGASASTTLDPRDAYDIMNIFDSRFEYGWASDKSYKDQELRFSFNKSQKIDKLKIWNGYQRSDVHCYANSRAKTIELVGDNNYKDTIQVKDIMGGQTILLNKVFSGKNLTLKIREAFRGRSYKDLVISELRFGYEDKLFMISPLDKLKSIMEGYRNQFRQANLESVLNKSLILKEQHYGAGKLRLRSDGSFFSNYSLGGDNFHISTYSLGGYEIKQVGKDKITIRVFGFIESQEEVWEDDIEGDCNGCGRDCNRNDSSSGKTRKLFQELLVITQNESGDIFRIKSIGGTGKLFHHVDEGGNVDFELQKP